MTSTPEPNKHPDLLAPAPILLPADPAADLLEGDSSPAEVAKQYPASSLAWAVLAEFYLDTKENRQILEEAGELADLTEDEAEYFHLSNAVTAYAFARTGYHRGLDALRKNGWKGFGPVPWSHEPNRGVLRAVASLALAADSIGEAEEFDRCRTLLEDMVGSENAGVVRMLIDNRRPSAD